MLMEKYLINYINENVTINQKQKKMKMKTIYIISYKFAFLWILALLLNFSGCAPMIAEYDNVAYQQALSLKVDSLFLMNKATESYSNQVEAVERLEIDLEKAYEYAKGRTGNEEIIKLWEIMKDPERNLVGGFLKRWEKNNTLSQTFIDESKKTISEGFDQIIGLEIGLIRK